MDMQEIYQNGAEESVASSLTSAASTPEPEVEDEPTYDDAFPALGGSAPGPAGVPAASSLRWGASTVKMAVKRSAVTQVFCVPLCERKYRENEEGFGRDAAEQNKLCNDISAKTGANIELSSAKDGSLTVVLTGKQESVTQARKQIIQRLQVQARQTINIPKEHHRFILGAKGKRLQDLENLTITKINIPRPDEASDEIHISGTADGIAKAVEQLQDVSDEQSKLDDKNLNVPKEYHPFVCGPNNQHLVELRASTGARINMPPPHVDATVITIRGEKEGVQAAYDNIEKIWKEKEKSCTTLNVDIKTGLKYVRGSRNANLSEILGETGVSVEIPRSLRTENGQDQNSGLITLRGEPSNLAKALGLVLEKAHSKCEDEVCAPDWLHRFIIGRKGEKINKITAEYPEVHIEISDGEGKINLEGPREHVMGAKECLEAIVADLKATMAFAVVTVEQKYHRHIIGKSGSNVGRIKEETGVQIRIPSETDASPNEIRIEGPPDGVEKAKKEIEELATKMANEKSRDIPLEQRFHREIIGAQGAKIREIRDRFNQVQISFPDSKDKSDVVTLRGPKNDVDQCFTFLQQVHKDLVDNNHQAHIKIFKDFHKNVIGKGGATIKKIRDETGTRIDLPGQAAESDIIVVTGKKEAVAAARDKIEAIQKELADIVEVVIEIPSKFHNSIIGQKGRLIKSVMDECGGVVIRFPQEGTHSDKVVVRGPKDDVEKARAQLQEIAANKQESGHTVEVRCPPQYHRFLIGKGGVNVRKIRETTGARVIFPGQGDDADLIVIMGKQEDAERARDDMMEKVKNLENTSEIEMSVDPKYHRHFVIRRGEVLRQIGEEFGGVTVSFPRAGVQSERVVLKGPTDLVEGAKQRIQEIVDDLEAQVTIQCVIEQKHHRNIMGPKGSQVQQIQTDMCVYIKFPERSSPKPQAPVVNGHVSPPVEEEKPTPVLEIEDWAAAATDVEVGEMEDDVPAVNGVNGHASEEDEVKPDAAVEEEEEEEESGPLPCDIILISGHRERCEEAKQALLALIPVTGEMSVPADLHRFIIGQRGQDVRKLMETHDVNISIPQADLASDVIRVTGTSPHVTAALEALAERVKELEAERADRVLRAFKLEIDIDPVHHPKIIGKKGVVISKIRVDCGVNIQFPAVQQQAAENGDGGGGHRGLITITGYEADCDKAKSAIMKIVGDIESLHREEVIIDARVHPRIIGGRGRNVKKIMDNYRVDIKFNSDREQPDLVVVSGAEQDVEDCCEELLNLAEEYLQDMLDDEKKAPSTVHKQEQQHKANQPGFSVRNAPWNAQSASDFPDLGASAAKTAPVTTTAWGPRRK